jgi:hypothetical protein
MEKNRSLFKYSMRRNRRKHNPKEEVDKLNNLIFLIRFFLLKFSNAWSSGKP